MADPDHYGHAAVRACLLELLTARAAESSICPSDVTRSLLSGNEAAWCALMPRIRSLAVTLAREDRIEITRGGLRLPMDGIEGGPIRLHRGTAFRA